MAYIDKFRCFTCTTYTKQKRDCSSSPDCIIVVHSSKDPIKSSKCIEYCRCDLHGTVGLQVLAHWHAMSWPDVKRTDSVPFVRVLGTCERPWTHNGHTNNTTVPVRFDWITASARSPSFRIREHGSAKLSILMPATKPGRRKPGRVWNFPLLFLVL
jgi:hypothetical protein